MKNLNLFIIIFTLLVTSGCKKLDIEPQNSVTFENYFKTENDLYRALIGVQADLRLMALDGSSNPVLKGEKLDVLNQSGSIFRLRNLDPIYYKSTTQYTSWNNWYRVIAGANLVIDNVSRPQGMTEQRKNEYLAQAYFYRSFAYFSVIKQWGNAPLIKNSLDVGRKGVTAWQAIADYIISDLEKAAEMLPRVQDLKDPNGLSITTKNAPAKGTANALLSQVYAWKAALNKEPALYAKAEEAATRVIEGGEYSLVGTPEEVCTKVLVGNSTEGIFEAPLRGYFFTEFNPYFISTAMSAALSYQSYPVFPLDNAGDIKNVSSKFLKQTVNDLYGATDLRKNAYFFKPDSMANLSNDITGGFAYPYKWRFPLVQISGFLAGQVINFNQDKVFIRLADIILLRAECRERQGKSGLAADDLNVIRNRAKAAVYPSASDIGSLQLIIFREREKELLMEGFRYYDILRNGYYRTELSSAFSRLSDQDIADGAFYDPVGNAAFSDNPEMRQNSYWLKHF
ncbi:RagB/SusD family nutrient uptake outer membrane protein [Pedobacter sp. MC2016-24]|uniref:RagB/SusD family nutrient uptake outer membrane protein n=1 Tax=Pedobacter sp. MC2016-24 TaxID=2780090 RepID=UPI00187F18AD|nr:RagB/SusD family nutrient uptake outer membrane protein [Pedobacter sp. MC2016-24]MBE9601573.1 RagB/SusD family nutrient uptake outer membrane protein [Pedobacter sp. MC2016-24]